MALPAVPHQLHFWLALLGLSDMHMGHFYPSGLLSAETKIFRLIFAAQMKLHPFNSTFVISMNTALFDVSVANAKLHSPFTSCRFAIRGKSNHFSHTSWKASMRSCSVSKNGSFEEMKCQLGTSIETYSYVWTASSWSDVRVRLPSNLFPHLAESAGKALARFRKNRPLS